VARNLTVCIPTVIIIIKSRRIPWTKQHDGSYNMEDLFVDGRIILKWVR
jgi:hypothetical protein